MVRIVHWWNQSTKWQNEEMVEKIHPFYVVMKDQQIGNGWWFDFLSFDHDWTWEVVGM